MSNLALPSKAEIVEVLPPAIAGDREIIAQIDLAIEQRNEVLLAAIVEIGNKTWENSETLARHEDRIAASESAIAELKRRRTPDPVIVERPVNYNVSYHIDNSRRYRCTSYADEVVAFYVWAAVVAVLLTIGLVAIGPGGHR